MSEIKFHFRDDWVKDGSAFTRGSAFLEGQLLQGRALSRYLDCASTAAEMKRLLTPLRGFFAVVRIDGPDLIASADPFRSIPFFYAVKDDTFHISDDPYWLADRIGDRETNRIAKLEFILAGYAAGEDTFCPRVKQIQAGELLQATRRPEGGFEVRRERDYSYLHGDYFEETDEVLLRNYDDMLIRVFGRLVEYAGDRTIVVPLSGGYDSRLIVLMLKRLGYEKILTYSYGKAGNRESQVSRGVAQNLGLQWEFVPYNHERWHEWFNSPERSKYALFADNLSTIPHLQDWPAVWELKKAGKLPADSVFVAGHSADLPSGGFSPKFPELYKDCRLDTDRLLDRIIYYQFPLWDYSAPRRALEGVFEERIGKTLGGVEKYRENAGAFEAWIAYEKCAKYVINSVRAYEFWGYDWWLPFWDREFIDFWCRCPLRVRLGRSLYLKHLGGLYAELSGIPAGEAVKRDGWGKGFVPTRNFLKSLSLWGLARSSYHLLHGLNQHAGQPMQFWGMLDEELRKRYSLRATHVNSVLVLGRLDYISLSGRESGKNFVKADKIISELTASLTG